MELSYAAYNPVEYEAIPGIPSSFMHAPYDDETRTAEFELETMGFDATAYNYEDGYCGYAAHTIGHKEITISNNNVGTGDNNNDINANGNAVLSSGEGASIYIPVVGSDTGKNIRNTIESGGSVSEIDETLSETESDDNSRTLIVVSIRGSVTPLDWAMDFASQIDWEIFNFEAGCQEIITSLNNYLYDNNDKIVGEPIILVTGHSLGAAIANLLAAELSATLGVEDVYAYTFGTPQVVTESLGQEAVPYGNIFNMFSCFSQLTLTVH